MWEHSLGVQFCTNVSLYFAIGIVQWICLVWEELSLALGEGRVLSCNFTLNFSCAWSFLGSSGVLGGEELLLISTDFFLRFDIFLVRGSLRLARVDLQIFINH